MSPSYDPDIAAMNLSWGRDAPPVPLAPPSPQPHAPFPQPQTYGRTSDSAGPHQPPQWPDMSSSRQHLGSYASAQPTHLQAPGAPYSHAQQGSSLLHPSGYTPSCSAPPSGHAQQPVPASWPENAQAFAQNFLQADGRARHDMISRCLASWAAATPRSPAAAARCQDNLAAAVRASTDSPARLTFVDGIASAFILGLLFPELPTKPFHGVASSAQTAPPAFNARPGTNQQGAASKLRGDEAGIKLAAGWLQVHPRGTALPQGLATVLQGASPGPVEKLGAAAKSAAPSARPPAASTPAPSGASTSTEVLRIVHRIVTTNSRAAELLLPSLLASTIASAESPAVAVGAPNPRLVAAMDQARVLTWMMEGAGLSPYDRALDRAFAER
jgi:hypothetical protein